MLIATYGSLKKGFYNHNALGGDATFIGNSSVHGVMYWNGRYPKLYKVVNDDYDSPFRLPTERKHKLEIYDISDEAYNYIRIMEIGSGYEEEKIDTEWGSAIIYWMPHKYFDIDDEWIKEYALETIHH